MPDNKIAVQMYTVREATKTPEDFEKALEKIGDDLKDEGKDEFEDSLEKEKPPLTSKLDLGPVVGNSRSIELTNDVPVRGVQCTLNGARPTEVRTTSRTEGFVAQYNEKNGTVILISVSGNTIAPGTGPIAEVVSNSTGPASLSKTTIVE